jgi:hypothetical protein
MSDDIFNLNKKILIGLKELGYNHWDRRHMFYNNFEGWYNCVEDYARDWTDHFLLDDRIYKCLDFKALTEELEQSDDIIILKINNKLAIFNMGYKYEPSFD